MAENYCGDFQWCNLFTMTFNASCNPTIGIRVPPGKLSTFLNNLVKGSGAHMGMEGKQLIFLPPNI